MMSTSNSQMVQARQKEKYRPRQRKRQSVMCIISIWVITVKLTLATFLGIFQKKNLGRKKLKNKVLLHNLYKTNNVKFFTPTFILDEITE